MKKRKLWCSLFIIGVIPFLAPFIGFAYEMIISSSWSLIEWLILYSFVYWPTYVVGLTLILVATYRLKR